VRRFRWRRMRPPTHPRTAPLHSLAASALLFTRTLYSVRSGERMMSLLMSLNSFQSSSALSISRNSGSNLGPPGMHMLSALAVKNDLLSNR
jgi:hypothetical protein